MACDTPYMAEQKGDGPPVMVPVPCGRCPPCKKRRASSWTFRLMQEDKVSTSSYFITLTYDTDNVPINDSGQLTLNKRDWQLFMKRLRRQTTTYVKKHDVPNPTIRYYAVGEYGSKRYRPHYHAIIYNVPDVELIYSSWELGTVHIGTVSGASVAYTSKYIDKPTRIPAYEGDDRLPEFSLMSNGLGKNYINAKSRTYHQSDPTGRYYVSTDTGLKLAMPRYYRDQLFTDAQKKEQNKAALYEQYENNIIHRREFEQKFKGSGYTFEQYLESQVYARYEQFYKNQKPRE